VAKQLKKIEKKKKPEPKKKAAAKKPPAKKPDPKKKVVKKDPVKEAKEAKKKVIQDSKKSGSLNIKGILDADAKIKEQKQIKKSGAAASTDKLSFGKTPKADPISLKNSPYNEQLKKQTKEITKYTSDQRSAINKTLKSQNKALAKNLEKITRQNSVALKDFTRTINQTQRQSALMLENQRQEFRRDNQISQQNIKRYQATIAPMVDRPELTDQISEDFERVEGMDPFESISQQRDPISVNRAFTLTGFSKGQQESQKRQQSGIAGFRSQRIEQL
jgi:hypothetical protein